jgi:hypothetical protein
MQLYNKSKRLIDTHKPGTLFTVSEEEGAKLLALYEEHGDIIRPAIEEEKPVQNKKKSK